MSLIRLAQLPKANITPTSSRPSISCCRTGHSISCCLPSRVAFHFVLVLVLASSSFSMAASTSTSSVRSTGQPDFSEDDLRHNDLLNDPDRPDPLLPLLPERSATKQPKRLKGFITTMRNLDLLCRVCGLHSQDFLSIIFQD